MYIFEFYAYHVSTRRQCAFSFSHIRRPGGQCKVTRHRACHRPVTPWGCNYTEGQSGSPSSGRCASVGVVDVQRVVPPPRRVIALTIAPVLENEHLKCPPLDDHARPFQFFCMIFASKSDEIIFPKYSSFNFYVYRWILQGLKI